MFVEGKQRRCKKLTRVSEEIRFFCWSYCAKCKKVVRYEYLRKGRDVHGAGASG